MDESPEHFHKLNVVIQLIKLWWYKMKHQTSFHAIPNSKGQAADSAGSKADFGNDFRDRRWTDEILAKNQEYKKGS